MNFEVKDQQIMHSLLKSLTFTVPLGLEARTLAEKFCHKYVNSQKKRQVYLNTLAVAAVKYYLRCMGWETNWEGSFSYNPFTQGLMDVADLQVRNLGKLECRPMLPSSQIVFLPPEVAANRIGYVAVQLDETFKTATIVGFVKTATNSEIFISELESLENFLSHLHHIKQCKEIKEGVHLSKWFDNLFESSWIALEEIFGSLDERKFALRSVLYEHKAKVARAKILDLGLQLKNQSVVLLVAITLLSEQKVEIQVQLHPINGIAYLPSQVRLNLVSADGEIIQLVQSRSNDNYIQLKRFRGCSGESFYIQVSDGNLTIEETFVI